MNNHISQRKIDPQLSATLQQFLTVTGMETRSDAFKKEVRACWLRESLFVGLNQAGDFAIA